MSADGRINPAVEPSVETEMKALGAAARQAATVLAHADAAQKTKALQEAARAIRDQAKTILAANAQDMASAKDLSPAMRDRLMLDEKRVAAMAKGLDDVAALPDPIGGEMARWTRPNWPASWAAPRWPSGSICTRFRRKSW